MRKRPNRRTSFSFPRNAPLFQQLKKSALDAGYALDSIDAQIVLEAINAWFMTDCDDRIGLHDTDMHGYSLIHELLEVEEPELARVLALAEDEEGNTALLLAVPSGDREDVYELLAVSNATHRNKRGECAMEIACEGNQFRVLSVLLSQGVVDTVAPQGKSALSRAIENRDMECLTLLMQSGACATTLHAVDSHGHTPLTNAFASSPQPGSGKVERKVREAELDVLEFLAPYTPEASVHDWLRREGDRVQQQGATRVPYLHAMLEKQALRAEIWGGEVDAQTQGAPEGVALPASSGPLSEEVAVPQEEASSKQKEPAAKSGTVVRAGAPSKRRL